MKIDSAVKEELKKYLVERLQDQAGLVTIVAPYALDEAEVTSLKEKIPHLKNARVKTAIDKSLLGGVVIRFGSKMIDLSLKSQLQNLKTRLYGIT